MNSYFPKKGIAKRVAQAFSSDKKRPGEGSYREYLLSELTVALKSLTNEQLRKILVQVGDVELENNQRPYNNPEEELVEKATGHPAR